MLAFMATMSTGGAGSAVLERFASPSDDDAGGGRVGEDIAVEVLEVLELRFSAASAVKSGVGCLQICQRDQIAWAPCESGATAIEQSCSVVPGIKSAKWLLITKAICPCVKIPALGFPVVPEV